MRSGLQAGQRVAVRGQRWRVLELSAFTDCEALHLEGIDDANRRSCRTLLYPFDRAVAIQRLDGARIVTLTAWRAVLHMLQSAACGRYGQLRIARSAVIDLLPFQLEPALAAISFAVPGLLLADEVGLGKTIQAGLVIAELRRRGRADRILILTPAGLRDQWADELRTRFGMTPEVLDAGRVRELASELPPGINPWLAMPVAITSIDYVKQPEIFESLRTSSWDVLVIDEAHLVSQVKGGATDRHTAADFLASRSQLVVLVTATPHAGDDEAFRSLCRLGRKRDDSALVMFRRSKQDVGLRSDRRVVVRRITLTPSEHRVHTLLAAYTERVWNESPNLAENASSARLAALILRKRALSSVASLTCSLRRRLELLNGDRDAHGEMLKQTNLPLHSEDEEADDHQDDMLGMPGFMDVTEERQCLRRILEAAAVVIPSEESKLSVLMKLLCRVSQPAVIFTEYRDTLIHLVNHLQPRYGAALAALHGGLDRHTRRAVERDFTGGQATILIATDAAGEGLNLQQRCRLVINYELPWNPIRLEQRVGRVDRIGQSRRVHLINLVASGTLEELVLHRLGKRIARIAAAIGDPPNVLGDGTRYETACRMLDMVAESSRVEGPSDAVCQIDLSSEANAEATRLNQQRRKARQYSNVRKGLLTALEFTSPWVAAARHASLPRGILLIHRVRIVDGRGRLLEDDLMAFLLTEADHRVVHVDLDTLVLRRSCLSRFDLRTLLRRLTAFRELGFRIVTRMAGARLVVAQHEHVNRMMRMRRGTEVLQANRSGAASPEQIRLFQSPASALRTVVAGRLQQDATERLLKLFDLSLDATVAGEPELYAVLLINSCGGSSTVNANSQSSR